MLEQNLIYGEPDWRFYLPKNKDKGKAQQSIYFKLAMDEKQIKSSIIKFRFLMLFFTSLVSFIPSLQIHAQSTKPQYWFTYNHTGRVSERWSYGFDLNYRSNGIVPFNSTLIAARMGMNYHTKTGFRFTAGYAWFGTFVSDQDRNWLPENRIYEQAQYSYSKSKLNFTHRIRIEQRWRQLPSDGGLDETAVFFTNRFRYLFQLDGPIARKLDRKTSLRWQVANEFFIHNKEEIGYILFDQNRTLAGILIAPSQNVSLALLYQLILQQQPFLREIRTINSFRITLFHQLDFRKKKIIPVEEIPIID